MKFTRRELAGAIAGSAVISLAGPPQVRAQSLAPAADYLAASRQSHRENSEVLRKFDLPMSTEPAFTFKA